MSLLFPLLFIEPCPIYAINLFYAICLFSCDVDVQLSQQDLKDVWFSIFRQPIIIHVYIISSCSSPDSGTSYGILNLADVADVYPAECCQ